ncbi:MAG: IS110 family RNA-guided transposase [Planctomycetota bacterium]|jgi:transposase
MYSIGIDLHKKSITVCVMTQDRRIVTRVTLPCSQPDRIRALFMRYQPFQTVMEATGAYEWLFELLEPVAARVVLAHPKKLRVIAESTRKSDRLDATVLAEFLALDMIPKAYRPTPREREHRRLVRQRLHLKKNIRRLRSKIRWIMARYNADRPDLFTVKGLSYLEQEPVSAADRFVLDQLVAEWRFNNTQVGAIEKELRGFAEAASPAEAEARAVLSTIPGVGPVTVDVVLSEFGNVDRFRSVKRACAYAGLVPGTRESAGKKKELGITKEGSSLLRWALTEAAWRLVRLTKRWRTTFEALAKRRGRKRAITAIARHLLCVMVAMLKSGRRYQPGFA